MRGHVIALVIASTLSVGTAWAQPFAPNEGGVTMGHWHLNSRDIEVNRKIFLGMGGTPGPAGPGIQRVIFPGVVINLNPGSLQPPPTGGTAGTVVNHVGFTVQNVQESVAKWKAAGVPVQPGNNNRLDQAWVTTPDGLRVEILENKAQRFPIMHEHVHFFLPEAAIAQSQAWYVKTFGGKAGVRNNNPIVDIPGTQLRFNKVDTAQKTTRGTVLDHIGFDITDLQAFIKTLEAAGIKLDRPFTRNPQTGGALAFITDPWGTYIELNERPGAQYIN